MKKQVKRYIMQRILTEYVVPALILILVISIFYNIFFSVKFYSYREKCQDSLVMAISREASATKDYLQSILKDKNYSQYNMWRVYSHFNNLSSLCRTNSDIYQNAQSFFVEVGFTFIDDCTTPLCSVQGLYKDEAITQDEEEYMRRILEMMDKAFVGGYSQEGSSAIKGLNSRLQLFEMWLNDNASSPYLLIKAPA